MKAKICGERREGKEQGCRYVIDKKEIWRESSPPRPDQKMPFLIPGTGESLTTQPTLELLLTQACE